MLATGTPPVGGDVTASDNQSISIINEPPYKPVNINPTHEEKNVDLNANLNWIGGDPHNDTVTYDVYFGMNITPPLVMSNQSNTSYNPGLDYNKIYYWRIIAWDIHNDFNESEVWSFTTEKKPKSYVENQNPIADVSAGTPHYGFVGEEIIFNGSMSYDLDTEGYIVSWFWNFGDETNGTGETTTHIYTSNGTYNATLTVTDNDGATDKENFDVIIFKANNPPSTPIIDGPTTGHKNIDYEFKALSTDLDDDAIQYIFDWGDGEITRTEFLPNGTLANQTHRWNDYGEYVISVKVFDNQTESGINEFNILIDVVRIDDVIRGLLIDEDSEDIYDIFEDNDTKNQTDVELENRTYLIDSDGDGKWDYAYDQDTDGVIPYPNYVYNKYLKMWDTPGFEIIYLLAIIGIILIILRRKR